MRYSFTSNNHINLNEIFKFMPIIKSAVKRMRQTLKRRARNVTHKRNLRTATKAFAADKTAETLSKAQSEIDKAVKKNLMHKNTAARKKAQLAKAAKEAGAKVTAQANAKTDTKTGPKPDTKKTPAKGAGKSAAKAPAKTSAAKKPTAKKAPSKKAE